MDRKHLAIRNIMVLEILFLIVAKTKVLSSFTQIFSLDQSFCNNFAHFLALIFVVCIESQIKNIFVVK